MARLLLVGTIVAVPVGASTSEIVTSVELRSDASLPLANELLESVTAEVGEPWNAESIARSLRNLHAAGVASQIEVYRSPSATGVSLIFVLRARTLVESVEWVGTLGIERWRVRESVSLGEGEALVADRVFRSVYELQELYENEGYLNASVRVEIDHDEKQRRVIVRFRIDSGTPATVEAVSFDGELAPLTEATLATALRTRAGGRYKKSVVEDDRERLEDWLVERGYRQARVTEPLQETLGESAVGVTFAVELGPHFTVEARGDTRGLERRKLLPLRGNERYDDITVSEARERITTDYQERGHYDVEVMITERAEGGEQILEVTVEPGPRRELSALRFKGNQALTSERLQGVMQTAPKRSFSTGGGRLVSSSLEADLASLRALYGLEGFSQVEVGPPLIQEAGGSLEVEIPIVEGPRRMVARVDTSGIERFDVEQLLATLPLRTGGPYHRRREDEALDLIRARYEEEGYDLVQVTSRLEWSANRTLVDVAIGVLEGPRSVVERVIVRGQQKTRPEVIRRILDLDPGTPISRDRLRDLQRRLYGLGIFSRVDVRLVPGTPYSGGRDVMVEVREGKRRRLSYGFGYDSEDGARGLLGYSHANLWGRGFTGRVDFRGSERDSQARALLRQPYVGRFRLPVTYSVFSIEQDQESFRSRRSGAQIDVQRRRGGTRVGLLYTYKTVEIDGQDPALDLLSVDRDFREIEISSVTPSVLFDRRNDAVDPNQGWSATLTTEYAFPALDADEHFAKLFSQVTGYAQLGRLGVLAGSIRVGVIEPLGTLVRQDPICEEFGLAGASCEIKISERFFAGGRTTHRAYRRDGLGIRGATLLEVEGQDAPVPFGGAGLALANLDWRFPIAGPVGGTAFVDGGNLWADWRDVAPEDVLWGAGLGVRYASPIGPVRLEVGWKLDRLEGEDPYVVLFSFGNPF